MPFPPEVYLIGAQKAGTTTLAHLLSQHPNICVAKTKEPHFFSTYWHKGLAWYETQFSNPENAICLDASTTYSMAPLSDNNSRHKSSNLKDVPQRIYSVNPDAKFIYLLREPVARIYSAYCYYIMNGREYKDFDDAIDSEDFYFDVSNYYQQLALWLEYFPLDSFLFVLFEDMKQNPLETVKKCCRFIGVDTEVPIDIGEPKNKSKHVNAVGRRANRVFRELDYSGFGYLAPSFLRKSVGKLTTDDSKSFPKLSAAKQALLREHFLESNRKLELLTGLNLDRWRTS
ncbi:sulfotransferase domain-containing protein [Myxosarcina sp. GI1]|uniref:sulfotransferase domain-containing protein n=1 Tax=Myxosarcina sp. GI1 TaxID=1541065 RepID=UPI00056C0F41|nr:sulfotransferase domain-containing protein [Myxosarcina sp. GI1]